MPKRNLLLACIVLLISSLALPLTQFNVAKGASSSGFQSGRIVDDSFFFTSGTMSISDIQVFLNSKVPTCDTNHSRTSSPNDSGPPYICLKDFRQDIPGISADAYCDSGIGSGTNISAAQIIYEVSRACNINTKVLIVLLQKEQALITDTWPWQIQYDKTTGFGCPDNPPPDWPSGCDPNYVGFFKQLYYGARQLQRYVRQPNSFNYRVGRTSFIPYQANRPDCSGSDVTIQTQATAALYNYTPYQPNTAALNNLYGTGDECSAYGNRNFWRMFNDWFGPTTSDSNTDVLSFIRMNHSSGKVEDVGFSSIASYSYASRNILTGYPAISDFAAVKPLFWPPTGDLSFIRLNHSSGRAELVTFGVTSAFQYPVNYSLTGYPATSPDGAVVPLFWPPNGDLSFIRLNHSSGRAELVTFGASNNFKWPVNYSLTGYPAISDFAAVKPLFWPPTGDLSFIRLNHSSGRAELVTLSASSNFKSVVNYSLTGYPATSPDGAVVPLFKPNGDLSFIRLNHSSGRVEVVTFSASSNFQVPVDYKLTAYPAISDFLAVTTLFTR